jgi:hypothetical protein
MPHKTQADIEDAISRAFKRFHEGQTIRSIPASRRNKTTSGRSMRKAYNSQRTISRAGGMANLTAAIYAPHEVYKVERLTREDGTLGVEVITGVEPFRMCNTRPNEEGLLPTGADPRDHDPSGRQYVPGRA